MIDFIRFGLIVLSVVFHEWGHYCFLNYFGMFGGFKWRWWGIEILVDKTVKIELSKITGLMMYLSGFIFSFIVFIPWVFLKYPGDLFIGYQVVVSALDFYCCAKMIFVSSSFMKNEGIEEN